MTTTQTFQDFNKAHWAAHWSYLADPGDSVAQTIVRTLGAAEAYTWVGDTFTDLNLAGIDKAELRQRHLGYQMRRHDSHAQFGRDLDAFRNGGGRLVTPASSEWPTQLNDLGPATPFVLWVKGGPLNPGLPSVSFAGARASTAYGNRVAGELAAAVAKAGIQVVTGGGYGIDAAAGRAVNKLDGSAGRNTVILAGGHNHLYPVGNHDYFDEVLSSGGVLVSEVAPSARPSRWRFLERNRVVAAWSSVSVIVEAAMRSGAISVARRAWDLHRQVAVVPGPITSPSCTGSNMVLKEADHVITSGDDLVEWVR